MAIPRDLFEVILEVLVISNNPYSGIGQAIDSRILFPAVTF